MNTPAFFTSKAASREAAPYHLAVVGGGIVGRACALRLAQIGLRIAHIAPPAPASTPAGPAGSGDDMEFPKLSPEVSRKRNQNTSRKSPKPFEFIVFRGS